MTDPQFVNRFEELWAAARTRGFKAGLAFGDPFTAALWFALGQAEMAREFAAGQGAILAKLDALVQLAADYATVHNLHLTECPECRAKPDAQGHIIHASGCAAMWPNPAALRIPGEGL